MFLTGLVTIILMRTLRKDYARWAGQPLLSCSTLINSWQAVQHLPQEMLCAALLPTLIIYHIVVHSSVLGWAWLDCA